MSKLVREPEWRSTVVAMCRQCDRQLAWGSPAVIDPTEPWLAFHEACLQDVVLERVVALYDTICLLGAKDYQGRVAAAKELDRLRDEVSYIQRMLDDRRAELPGSFRPGVRREPPRP